jgi:AcrR family transcriptional regulator
VTNANERRLLIADTAIAVIGRGGMRSLTHRAVDSAAGLPSGTTSYHHRTRRDLLRATLNRIAEISLQRLRTPSDQAAQPSDQAGQSEPADSLASRSARFVDAQLSQYRITTLARFACEIEVSTDPELREILHAGDRFRTLAAAQLAQLGTADPQARGSNLVAFLEGLTYDRLVGSGSLTCPTPGTPASVDDLTEAIRGYLIGLIPAG